MEGSYLYFSNFFIANHLMYFQLAVLWEGWSTEKVGMGRWGIQQQKNCDAASGTRDGHRRIQNLFRGLTTGQLPNMWNCRKTYRINIIQNLGGVCVWEGGEGVVLEPLQPHSYLWLGSNILNICWCFGNWMPAFCDAPRGVMVGSLGEIKQEMTTQKYGNFPSHDHWFFRNCYYELLLCCV